MLGEGGPIHPDFAALANILNDTLFEVLRIGLTAPTGVEFGEGILEGVYDGSFVAHLQLRLQSKIPYFYF